MEFTESGEYVQSFKYSKGGDLLKEYTDLMPVFENGEILFENTFSDIRNRAMV